MRMAHTLSLSFDQKSSDCGYVGKHIAHNTDMNTSTLESTCCMYSYCSTV